MWKTISIRVKKNARSKLRPGVWVNYFQKFLPIGIWVGMVGESQVWSQPYNEKFERNFTEEQIKDTLIKKKLSKSRAGKFLYQK